MLKIATIIGARPQFIKAAVVSKAIASQDKIREVLVHTGQHYDEDLSDIFFKELHLPAPNYNLNIGSGSHGQQTGLMIAAIEDVLLKERPHCVLVYGDTNSTLAGALAAAKLTIPIVHVEAGMRSYNLCQPEEINRILTDRISQLLVAPSVSAANNLLREGLSPDQIIVVGDVMFDVANFFNDVAKLNSQILPRFKVKSNEYLLATIHRPENTDNLLRLTAIVNGLNTLSIFQPIIFPLHPRTKAALVENDLFQKFASRILITEPLGYLDMLTLTQNAAYVITDSGGLQKEAFYHKVSSLVIRDETEWRELVDLGWNTLISPLDLASVCFKELIAIRKKWENPYGVGNSASLIVSEISNRFL